jgi:hypothetical protein
MRAATLPAHVQETGLPLKALSLVAILVSLELVFGHAGSAPTQHIIDDTNSLAPAPLVDRSLNWSGYVADGGDYTSVSGSWIVPKVTGSPTLAADATWVGIGGTESRNLIQAGTQAIADLDGSVIYEAWMEVLPEESQTVPLPVHPGDVVSADISEVSPNLWSVTLKNVTTGREYHTSVHYRSTHTSAEWIEEMPSGNVPIELDDFGSLHFLFASATQRGATVTPSAAQARPVTMVNMSNEVLSVPSVLSDTGSSFKVERTEVLAEVEDAYANVYSAATPTLGGDNNGS